MRHPECVVAPSKGRKAVGAKSFLADSLLLLVSSWDGIETEFSSFVFHLESGRPAPMGALLPLHPLPVPKFQWLSVPHQALQTADILRCPVVSFGR